MSPVFVLHDAVRVTDCSPRHWLRSPYNFLYLTQFVTWAGGSVSQLAVGVVTTTITRHGREEERSHQKIGKTFHEPQDADDEGAEGGDPLAEGECTDQEDEVPAESHRGVFQWEQGSGPPGLQQPLGRPGGNILLPGEMCGVSGHSSQVQNVPQS